MNNYLVKGETLVAIADALRTKDGSTNKITLGNMPIMISKLNPEEVIRQYDIPSYVRKEALRVANLVQSVRKDNSIVFLAMSDSHQYGEQANTDTWVDTNGTQTDEGNLHAVMGAKILAHALDIDFMAHLGDVTWGSARTTSEILKSQGNEFNRLFKECHKDIPCFQAIGNHDTGIYYHNSMISAGNTGTYTESGEWLYNNFTALSNSEDTVFGGIENGGYCYRDFTDKKLRVFLLNTSETLIKNQSDNATTASQRKWFAEALLDLNTKNNPEQWNFIILSHYPADYGGTMPLSELLKAYIEGTSITIAVEDGTTATINFTGANSAKMIAQFHGHVHNFLTSRLYSYATGSGVKYDAWRMGIPNSQYNRENYYTTLNAYPDISFAETNTYAKTPDTAQDTSFVINVINPSEEKVYSFCYGAGYDRVMGYDEFQYYLISTTLGEVTYDNTTTSIKEEESYIANFTVNEGHYLKSISITMNDVDITNEVYADGVINIPSVTGNVNIIINTAVTLSVTNQIPISTDVDGSIYNGKGYKEGIYINSNGIETSASEFTTTGFIPYTGNETYIYFSNFTFNALSPNVNYHRISYYDENKNYYGQIKANSYGSVYYLTLDAEGDWKRFYVKSYNHEWVTPAYIRISAENITDESIITVGEEITPTTADYYGIRTILTNVSSSSTVNLIRAGGTYTTTLTANPGYVLDSVKVYNQMDDITSETYNSSTQTIKRIMIYGCTTITASAIATGEATYINQIPLSTDTDGSIFNGVGYQSGYRLSSGGVLSGQGDSYVTGFIPCAVGDDVYMKNITFQYGITSGLTSSNQRISFYDANKTHLLQANATSLGGICGGIKGDDNIWTQFTVPGGSGNIAYFRINGSYIGEDSIITINQEITD